MPRLRGARPAPLALGREAAGVPRPELRSAAARAPPAAHCRAGVGAPRPRARPAGPEPAPGLLLGAGRRPPVAAVQPGPCPAEAEATRHPRPASVSGRRRSGGLGPAEAAATIRPARLGPGPAVPGRRETAERRQTAERRETAGRRQTGRREESTPERPRERVAARPGRRAEPRRAEPEARARPEAVERRRAPGPGPSPAGAAVTRRLRASPVSTPRWAPPCRAGAVASTPSATPARCLPAPRAGGRQPRWPRATPGRRE